MNITADSSIISPQTVTTDQCSRFLLSKPHGEYNDEDISKVIVPEYERVCLLTGVNLAVVIAQLHIETNNLCSALSQRRDKDGRDLRNPGGIGVYEARNKATAYWRPGTVYDADADVQGYRPACQFADWKQSIVAHVGRLVAYATPVNMRTGAQATLVRQALAYRSLPLSFQGTAPTLKALGKAHNPKGYDGAGWASPGDTYGQHIADVANRIAEL